MQPVANSVAAYGTQVAPADNLAIATIASASLPAGRYACEVAIGYGGTLGAMDGFDVRAGATTIAQLPIAAVANQMCPVPYKFVRDLDGSTALTVNAHGAGPAMSVYNAVVVATRIRS